MSALSSDVRLAFHPTDSASVNKAAAVATPHLPFAGSHKDGKVTHLAIVITGQRCDILPHIALAYALQASGFRVLFVSNAIHASVAAQYGLAFTALKGDPHSVIQSAVFRDGLERESHFSMAAELKRAVDVVLEENMAIIHNAVKDADAILCGLQVLTECMAIGQKYQIPVIMCPLLPFSPNGEIPVAHILPEPSKWTWLNRLTYDLSGMLLWAAMGSTFNRFRTNTLRIGPQSGFILEGLTQVTAFNDIVIPRPRDWGTHICTSGMWHLPAALAHEQAARSHPRLAALLAGVSAERSTRPIFIGFDAYPVPEPVAFIRRLHAYSRKLGVPFIFATGGTDVEAVRTSVLLNSFEGIVWETEPERSTAAELVTAEDAKTITHVHVVRDVPLMWVFPRCSLAVHHGSSLATQTALEAGVPQVVFPAFGEHYFWAARVSHVGAGPLIYYPFRDVMRALGECIAAARHSTIVTRATEIGEIMRARGDGTQSAVAAIRNILVRPQNRHCGITCTWVKDDASPSCSMCNSKFTLTNRRHHCRSCGRLIDAPCVARCHLPGYPETEPQMACMHCVDARRAFMAVKPSKTALPESVDTAGPSTRVVALDSPDRTPAKQTREAYAITSAFDSPAAVVPASMEVRDNPSSRVV